MSGSVQWWPVLPDDAVPADAAGVWTVDCGGVADKPALLAALRDALELPEWTGSNWDALEERLRSFDGDVWLVLRDLGALRHGEPIAFQVLLAVLADTVAFHAEAGRAFTALLAG